MSRSVEDMCVEQRAYDAMHPPLHEVLIFVGMTGVGAIAAIGLYLAMWWWAILLELAASYQPFFLPG